MSSCVKLMMLSGSIATLAVADRASAQDLQQRTDSGPQTEATSTSTDTAAAGSEGDEIVVTGIRGATRDALATKQDASIILDALSAEDIGDLPDLNAGDALVRLPGVSAGAGTAEPESLSIRGFSSEFGLTTFNGRVLTSDRSGRNVRTNLFPSSLLSQVAVFKTPTAKMIEGGLSGTVELSTGDPLATIKRQKQDTIVRLTGRYSYDTGVEGVTGFDPGGYRVDGSIRQSFFDRKLGIGLGFSRSVLTGAEMFIGGKRPVLDGALIRPGFTPITTPSGQLIFDDDANTRTPDPFADNEALIAPGQLSYGIEAFKTKRTAGTLLMTFEPTDNLTFKFDSLIGREESVFDQAQLFISFFGDGISGTVDETGFIDNVLFSGPLVDSLPRERLESTDTIAAGFNAEWALGPWTISPDFFYSRVTLDRFTAEATIRPGTQRPQAYISSGNQFGSLGIEFVNFDPANPASLTFRDLQLDRARREDEAYSGRLDVRRDLDLGIFSSLEFGGRYETRRKLESFDIDNYNNAQFQGRFSTADLRALRTQFLSSNLFGRFDAGQPIPREWFQLSPFAILDGPLKGVAPNQLNTAADALASSVVEEQTIAGYLMTNLSGNLGPVPFSGNVGVRVIRTDIETTGSTGTFQLTRNDAGILIFAVNNNSVEPITQSNSFTDILPSLNLQFRLNPRLRLRLGAARTIARPPYQYLFPARRLGVEQELDDGGLPTGPSVLTISGGNPEVEPYRANNLDVSLEWSPNRDMLVAVAGFYKNIDSIIVGGQQVTTSLETPEFGTLPLRLTTFLNEKPPETVVQGLEFQAQTVFSMLPSPFDGLGVSVNYSYIDSRITEVVNDFSLYTETAPDGTIQYVLNERNNELGTLGGVRQPLPNIAEHLGNLTVFYEKGPIGIRLAGRFRSGSYERDPLAANNIRAEGRPVFDANFRYNLGKGVTFVAQARNITNQYKRSYYYEQRPLNDPIATATFTEGGRDNRLRDLIFRGRDFFVGVNISL